MVLESLEFTECLFDNPLLREKISSHEKELDRTSKCIKNLISDTKDIHSSLKSLSKAQCSLARTLKGFEMECINTGQTDDEDRITCAMKKFAVIIEEIEESRQTWMDVILDTTINDLENYRKNDIGEVKNQKKLFDKQSQKYSQYLDKYLQLKSKSSDDTLLQADAQLITEMKGHNTQYMKYVKCLLEIDQSKKYKFVETLLTQMINQWNYFRLCNDINKDKFLSERGELQKSLSMCRSNFEVTTEETEQLCTKLCDMHTQQSIADLMTNCEGKKGYLFVMEKKALVTTWNKYYCIYNKHRKEMRMIQFQPGQSKYPSLNSPHWNLIIINQCIRRASESIERRFCFDLQTSDKNTPVTVQATNEVEMKSWLNILDGKDPIYITPQHTNDFETTLDDFGFQFVKMCILAIEARGLDEQGLYRIVGVNSKIHKLTTIGLDRKKQDKLDLMDEHDYELKTITSALKNYFRKLPDPIMSFDMHDKFLAASHLEALVHRRDSIHRLIYELKPINFEILKELIHHLKRISDNHLKNRMNISNLGICFGPTLMRSPCETIASIMNLKFCNIVIEILIEYYDKIFCNKPSMTNDIPCNESDTLKDKVPSKSVNRNNSSGTVEGHVKKPGVVRRLTTTVADARLEAATKSAAISAALREKRDAIAHHKRSNTVTGGAGDNNTPTSKDASAAILQAGHRPASSWQTGSISYSSVTGQIVRTSDTPLSRKGSRTRPLNRQDPQSVSQEDAMRMDGVSKNMLHHAHSISSSPKRSEQFTSTYPRNPPSNNDRNVTSAEPPWLPVSPYWNSEPQSNDQRTSSTNLNQSSSNLGSVTSLTSSFQIPIKRRTLRTLYSCEAECDTELSFKPNEIIRDVQRLYITNATANPIPLAPSSYHSNRYPHPVAYQSGEPGWLYGTMNGKVGMIPENYVEDVPDEI